jgi:hypothetical protein
MHSLIVYGRNDNHGYNYHKRASLSLNCISEVLNNKEDEIIFVDYNTPNDLPTFPEAISDLLTKKAKKVLRVIRVRPEIHKKFVNISKLPVNEPLSRNIGARRINKNNSWMLHTNTDMIFYLEKELIEITKKLEIGHYGIPRFSLPPLMWEKFDRLNPNENLKFLNKIKDNGDLNEIVKTHPPFIFDAPGDFQLISKEAFEKVCGYDETMILGWHVDANISKRLSIIYGDIKDLSSSIKGYHLDHFKNVTKNHQQETIGNDINKYFFEVKKASIENQKKNWGIKDHELEEFKLDKENKFSIFFNSQKKDNDFSQLISNYNGAYYGKSKYKPESACLFLFDYLSNFRNNLEIFWYGKLGETFKLFKSINKDLNHFKKIHIIDDLNKKTNFEDDYFISDINISRKDTKIQIFDFSDGNGNYINQNNTKDLIFKKCLIDYFKQSVDNEIIDSQLPEYDPKTYIAINSINTDFENIFNEKINCIKTPFFNKIRYGTIKDNLSLPKLNDFDFKNKLNNGLLESRNNFKNSPGFEKKLNFFNYINPNYIKQKNKNSLTLIKCETNIASVRNFYLKKNSKVHINAVPLKDKKNNKIFNFQLMANNFYIKFKTLIGFNNDKRIRKFGKFFLGTKYSNNLRKFILNNIFGRNFGETKNISYIQTTVFAKNSHSFKTHQSILDFNNNHVFPLGFDKDQNVDLLISYFGSKNLEIRKLTLYNQ